MDLSTIQMHLDNFVNTWEGWHKIASAVLGTGNGVNGIFNILGDLAFGLSSDEYQVSDAFANTSSVLGK